MIHDQKYINVSARVNISPLLANTEYFFSYFCWLNCNKQFEADLILIKTTNHL
jgi:hypothetical protein